MRMRQGRATKGVLHQLVDELPDEQADLARELLEDLRNGAEEDGPRLIRRRWRHLCGQFETDETDSIEGAKPLYLSQRQPEFEIADLRIDVELQKQYGIDQHQRP